MRVGNAPRRLALDTVSYFTPYAKAFWALGYRTVFRYLNYERYFRKTPCTSPKDWFKSLSVQELRELLDVGFNVGIVQRGIGKRNKGGAGAGQVVGENAVYNAQGIGLPDGVHIFCDCEWSSSHMPTKLEQVEYIESWAARRQGYRGGQYVCHTLKLNADELYALRGITSYWFSAAAHATVNTRGPGVIQSLEYFYRESTGEIYEWSDACYKYKGLRFDTNMICIDGKPGSLNNRRVKVVVP